MLPPPDLPVDPHLDAPLDAQPDAQPDQWYRPVQPANRRRQWLSKYAGALVAAGLLVVIVVVSVVVKGDDSPWAERWDPRVTDIVDFVERERGMPFRHPVHVDFLTEDEYRQSAGGFADPDDATVAYFEDEAAILNAQGLVGEGYDALEAIGTFEGELTLGYYSPDTKHMVVIGTELSPATRVVLAHELTHALQDQYFDLGLGAEAFTLRAIVEADALRVDAAYRATLSADEQAAADLELNGGEAEQDAAASIPWPVLDRMFAPYGLGPALVEVAFAEGGNAAVDVLIQHPPTEEVLANPWLPANEPQVGSEFAAPGTEIRPITPLSYLTVLTMLDAWLPWEDARTALVGWNGGGARAVVELDKVCFEMFAEMADPEPLATALTNWAEASGSSGRPTVTGSRVDLTACERTAGRAPAPTEITTVGSLQLEQFLVDDDGLSTAPEDLPALYCYAGALVDGPAAEVLIAADPTPAEQARLDDARTTAATTCGVSP